MQRGCRACKNNKFDLSGGDITWSKGMCCCRSLLKNRNKKYVKKPIVQSGNLRQCLEKGNGITLFGTSVMLVTFLFFYLLVQVFLLSHRSSGIQQAVDNVSDSVAVYMATEGEGYTDASSKAFEVASTIKSETGIDLGSVLVNASDLEDNIVTVKTSSDYNGITLYRGSSTYFTPGSGLREKIVSYAMMWVGVTPYENPPKGYTDQYLTIGTDCSGFVYTIFQKFGITLYTGSDIYQYMSAKTVTIQQAQPGDILVYGNGQHVCIYAGDGFVVNCGGGGPDGKATYEPYTYRSDLTRVISVLD